MSAYVRTVTDLRQNVYAEVKNTRQAVHAGDVPSALQSLVRLMDQLDADVREVRADFEQVIAGGEW